MPMIAPRLARIERSFGVSDDECGPLTCIAPKAWDDADRECWQRSRPLPDAEADADLIAKYHGHRPRPCARGHVVGLIVPAPAAVEEADEATRAAWRLARGMRA